MIGQNTRTITQTPKQVSEMANSRRVEWTELRRDESFLIVAEKTPTGWAISDKSIWEVRWYPLAPTRELVQKAEKLAFLGRTSVGTTLRTAHK